MDMLFVGFYFWLVGLSIIDRINTGSVMSKLKEIGENTEYREKYIKETKKTLDKPINIEEGVIATIFFKKLGLKSGFLLNTAFIFLVYYPLFLYGFYHISKITQLPVETILMAKYFAIGIYAGMIFKMLHNNFFLRKRYP